MNQETTKGFREAFTQVSEDDNTAEIIAQSYQRIDASRELLGQTARLSLNWPPLSIKSRP